MGRDALRFSSLYISRKNLMCGEAFCNDWPPCAKLAPTATSDGNRMDETLFRIVGSTDAPGMKPLTDPPPGFVAVPLKGALPGGRDVGVMRRAGAD